MCFEEESNFVTQEHHYTVNIDVNINPLVCCLFWTWSPDMRTCSGVPPNNMYQELPLQSDV